VVPDLLVGNKVEVLDDKPGWVLVLLQEAGAGIFAGEGDICEIILGVG
jgi:hypothetical protein